MAVIELTRHNFDAEAAKESKAVLIDFSAAWCGPCRMLSPIVDEIVEEAGGAVKVCKVDIDKEPELAERFGVMSIPTLVVLKDGKTVSASVGLKPKRAILQIIEEAE